MAFSPEEMIQNILNDPEAMGKAFEMIGNMSGGGGNGEESSGEESDAPFGDPEMLFRIFEIFSKLQNNPDDNETRLITALKPYLSERRAESADKAIKLMKISKMSSLLGDFNIF